MMIDLMVVYKCLPVIPPEATIATCTVEQSVLICFIVEKGTNEWLTDDAHLSGDERLTREGDSVKRVVGVGGIDGAVPTLIVGRRMKTGSIRCTNFGSYVCE